MRAESPCKICEFDNNINLRMIYVVIPDWYTSRKVFQVVAIAKHLSKVKWLILDSQVIMVLFEPEIRKLHKWKGTGREGKSDLSLPKSCESQQQPIASCWSCYDIEIV